MSTNYNQLLKDLEIGSVYVKILICFLGCTFMLSSNPQLSSSASFLRLNVLSSLN
mgnify:CR=1 FL=1